MTTTKGDNSVAAIPAGTERTCNIAALVSEAARRFPDKPAVVNLSRTGGAGRPGGVSKTFKQLDEEIDRFAHGLERVGIARGTRCILMVQPGLEFFALTFALFKVGAVVVLIDPGMGRRRMIDCLAEVEAEAFIGVPLAQVARIVYSRKFRSVRTSVTLGRRWFWGGHRLAQVRAGSRGPYHAVATRPGDPAAILFTSGSTGPAKGVCYEHGMFEAQVRYLQSHYGYSPDEVDLATFPLFALFDAALGMTAVIPDMDASRPALAEPEKIIRAIDGQGATHMFGSPALLDRLSRYCDHHRIKLPTLRRVMTAGAPVPHSVLERMRRVVGEQADIHTPYGATESLPVASIESREILRETRHRTAGGQGICVGKPLPGMQVRIIKIGDVPVAEWADDNCLPTNEIGEICVKGPVVTKEYFHKPHATAAAKIPDGDGLWHRMGDVGYIDDQGRLWFCGRKSHRVRTADGTLFTICCEALFNRHPRVKRSALVGIGRSGRQKPVLCVETEENDGKDRQGLTEELLQIAGANELTRDIQNILFHPSFPVDARHNAKIFREKLAVWAAERLK